MAEQTLRELPEAQRAFVEQLAQYYYENDGMPHSRGQVIGWLIISEPKKQRASEIARRLDIDRADVDWITGKLIPAAVLVREDIDGSDDYYVEMGDNAWVNRMQQVFSKIPEFHQILAEGVALLEDSDGTRRQRVVTMERFFGYLATEIPGIFDRYRETVRTGRG
jgi:hypothetical protein